MVEVTADHYWEDCCKKLYWFFLLLLFLAPLPYGSNRPWAWGGLEVLMFVLLAFWAVQGMLTHGAAGSVPSGYRWPILLLVLWSLYPLWQILSWSEEVLLWISPATVEIRRLAGWRDGSGAISLDLNVTWQAWLKGMIYLGGFWLTLVWIHSMQRMNQLMLVLVISGAFQAMYGLLMVSSDPTGAVTGTFANRNHLAGLLEMTIPVAIGLMMSWMRPKEEGDPGFKEWLLDWLHAISGRRGILSMVMVIMLLAIFLTHSRAGNVSLLVALLVVTGLGSLRRSTTNREGRILTPLLMVSFVVGIWYGVGNLTGRLISTDFVHEGRWEVLIKSIGMFNDFRWFGCGSGTFAWVYPLYRVGESTETFLDHAHNDHVELLVEQGGVGYGLLVIGVISCWFFMVQGYWRRRDPLVRGVLFACLVGTFSLSLHGLFDFNFQIPSNALYFMVLLAMGLRGAVMTTRSRLY